MKEFMASIAENLPALREKLASTNFDQVQVNIFYYGISKDPTPYMHSRSSAINVAVCNIE